MLGRFPKVIMFRRLSRKIARKLHAVLIGLLAIGLLAAPVSAAPDRPGKLLERTLNHATQQKTRAS